MTTTICKAGAALARHRQRGGGLCSLLQPEQQQQLELEMEMEQGMSLQLAAIIISISPGYAYTRRFDT